MSNRGISIQLFIEGVEDIIIFALDCYGNNLKGYNQCLIEVAAWFEFNKLHCSHGNITATMNNLWIKHSKTQLKVAV